MQLNLHELAAPEVPASGQVMEVGQSTLFIIS